MSGRGKTTFTSDEELNVQEYRAQSWTIDEFVESVKDPAFLKLIQPQLDASNNDGADATELIQSKFHFAGASSRYMFDYSTERVVSEILDSVEVVEDVMKSIKGAEGIRSPSTVNRLFTYNETECKRRLYGILSEFAATTLAQKTGPDLIKRLSAALHDDLNPAMNGWLLEMYFFAALRHSGIKYHYKEKELSWPASVIQIIDPKNIESVPSTAQWFKPKLWNQGGYDAVYLDPKESLVLFVQVSRAKTHTFKIHYFYLLLQKLANFMKIHCLEIYFLSREGNETQISTVTGAGLLEPYGAEWKKGNETEAVRKVAIGWD